MAVELIDSHVSSTQAKLAVDALLKHARKERKQAEETELLGAKDDHVWLVVGTKQMQPEKKLKPHSIPLEHPIIDPRTTQICLITKDPQREYKDRLEKEKIKFIGRVVDVSKLKGKFRGYEERRQLLRENGLFLADERVIPLMPQVLGKAWFKAKKQPIPVNLTRKDLKAHLERAVSSTYMHQNQGTCISVKLATISHSHSQIYENLKKALPPVISHIKNGWDNIQNIHIKTSRSVSLPIWTCDLGSAEGGRWEGMMVDEQSENSSNGDETESDSEKGVLPSNKKKRPADVDEGTPKKKAKSTPVVHAPESTTDSSTRKKSNKKKSQSNDDLPPISSNKGGSERKNTLPTDPDGSDAPAVAQPKSKQRKTAADFIEDVDTTAEITKAVHVKVIGTPEHGPAEKKSKTSTSTRNDAKSLKPVRDSTTVQSGAAPKRSSSKADLELPPQPDAKSKPVKVGANTKAPKLNREELAKKREGSSLEKKKKVSLREKPGKNMGRGVKGAVLRVP